MYSDELIAKYAPIFGKTFDQYKAELTKQFNCKHHRKSKLVIRGSSTGDYICDECGLQLEREDC
jgi:hypothetical protein